ncbi:response regulator transcription factor [Chitinimonas sp. BJYL2]|uniref:response regulator n=1 Tax=Chitinimonas sp. BJYL2 TaxID=2976696 RepID=UPI0022B57C41|nr:response regulator transcription factor [Chitinimonas sp. BJYL2]
MSTQKLTVLIADDHLLIRRGIRALLDELGHEVVAEAGDGAEALAMILALSPDLALIDIAMPVMSGVEVVLRAAAAAPQTRLLYLSAQTDAVAVREALRAGADGYLLKDFVLDELDAALAEVQGGGRYLSPGLPAAVRESITADESELLTPRQLEVLRGLALGHSLKQIARDLDVSPKTVEFHRAKLSERLGIRDIPSLAVYASRLGLVPLTERNPRGI